MVVVWCVRCARCGGFVGRRPASQRGQQQRQLCARVRTHPPATRMRAIRSRHSGLSLMWGGQSYSTRNIRCSRGQRGTRKLRLRDSSAPPREASASGSGKHDLAPLEASAPAPRCQTYNRAHTHKQPAPLHPCGPLSRSPQLPHPPLHRSPTWIIFCSFWLSCLSSGRSKG